jgi:kinesin family protein C2/C3
VFKLLYQGSENRSVGSTCLNEMSSRSHLILTIYVSGKHHELNKTFKGKLNLIDLAGSERIAKSEAEGTRMKEAVHINSR